MKNSNVILTFALAFLTLFISCNKKELLGENNQKNEAEYLTNSEISDSVSSVANSQVKDKQFIKSAEVKMEVEDVYKATVSIEKSLTDLGGFVTKSELNSDIISEKTFNISNEKAMMIRKFQTFNNMQVRIPTAKLAEFLQIINDKKVFLNSRIITAEDVTANIKIAELEAKRSAKTNQNISQLKVDKDKVKMSDESESEINYQKIAGFEMTDNLKYSTVQISLKEPQIRVAQIAVANSQNLDDQYQYNFFYDAKNALTAGFYLIQSIIVGLFKIWPLILIGGIILYFFRKRKTSAKAEDSK